MSDRSMTPTTRPIHRRRVERTVVSPAGAQGARPAAQPLPAAGRAASDSLLREVESLLADERALRLVRQGQAPPAPRHR